MLCLLNLGNIYFSRISINHHGTRGFKRRVLSDQFRIKQEKLRGSKYITRILEKKKVLSSKWFSVTRSVIFVKACLQVECRTCSASWPNLGWSWWESAMQHPEESYGNHSTGERSAVDFRVAQWLDFERLGSKFWFHALMLFTVHMQRGTISAALFAGIARVVYSESFEIYTNDVKQFQPPWFLRVPCSSQCCGCRCSCFRSKLKQLKHVQDIPKIPKKTQNVAP